MEGLPLRSSLLLDPCFGKSKHARTVSSEKLFIYSFVLGVCALCCSLFSGCSEKREIVVNKSPISIDRRIYDIDNRPDEQVARHPSVEANTHWDFGFVPQIRVQRVKLIEQGGRFTSLVKVRKVELDLSLLVKIWLPESASSRVVEHEDGHVAICKHFYSNAEKQAFKAAEGVLGREFLGSGETENESMDKAVESASAALAAPFRNAVIIPASNASSIYDALTKHGQSDKPVDIAVKEALGQTR